MGKTNLDLLLTLHCVKYFIIRAFNRMNDYDSVNKW